MDGSGSLPMYAIAVIAVLATLLFITLVAVVACFIVCKRRNQMSSGGAGKPRNMKVKYTQESEMSQAALPVSIISTRTPTGINTLDRPSSCKYDDSGYAIPVDRPSPSYENLYPNGRDSKQYYEEIKI